METRAPPYPMLRHLPHVLSLARVGLVGVTYFAAFARDEALFALLVLMAVLTDILDGPLARHWGTANRFGANVDSAADLLFYMSLPAWAYLFQPDVIFSVRVLVPIFTLAMLYLGANWWSHRVFGALGVHNRLSRTSGTVGVAVTFYTIIWGLHWITYYGLILVLSADLAQRYGALLQALRERRSARAQAR